MSEYPPRPSRPRSWQVILREEPLPLSRGLYIDNYSSSIWNSHSSLILVKKRKKKVAKKRRDKGYLFLDYLFLSYDKED